MAMTNRDFENALMRVTIALEQVTAARNVIGDEEGIDGIKAQLASAETWLSDARHDLHVKIRLRSQAGFDDEPL